MADSIGNYCRKAALDDEPIMDSAMVAATKEGAIQHKRLIDGEITQFEYETLREEILVKHGI